jgi:hypothetical protein
MNERERLLAVLSSLAEGDYLAKLLLDLVGEGSEEDQLYLEAILKDAVNKRQAVPRSPGAVSDAEKLALDLVLEGRPLTADDVAAQASQTPGLPKTVAHRSGASALLNGLVENGLLGKFHYGREVIFASVQEAVFEAYKIWLRDQPRGQGNRITEIDPLAISEMTGVPVARVLRELRAKLSA